MSAMSAIAVEPSHHARSRQRRAVTIIELIVSFVIIAIIAGVAAVGYTSVINNAKTRSTEVALTQMHKTAMAVAMTENRPVTLADFQNAANALPQLTALGSTPAQPVAAAPVVEAGSDSPVRAGTIAVSIDPVDPSKVGVAGYSSTGECVTLAGVGMRATTSRTAPSCTGNAALVAASGTPTADPTPTPTATTPADPLPSTMTVSTYTSATLGSNSWGDLIYANGKFVAFGDSYAATSTDGRTWTRTSTAQPFSGIVGLAYGNGRYVAIASGGTIYTSTNASSWTKSGTSLGNGLVDLVFADGVFVITSSQAAMYVSSDGLSWTQRGAGASSGCLVNGSGLWVQMPGADNFTPARKTTTPAVPASWTTISSIPLGYGYYKPQVCTYGNGRFVAGTTNGSLIRSSADGNTWSSTTTFTPSAITFANGEFVALSGNTMRTSVDGTTWASRNIGQSLGAYLYGAAGGGRMVFIGNAGEVLVAE